MSEHAPVSVLASGCGLNEMLDASVLAFGCGLNEL
jgi:hypothetical protein